MGADGNDRPQHGVASFTMSRDPARTPVIVDGLRTPFGRYGGALKDVRPDDLAAHVIRALVERTGIDPSAIDDVILGAANQAGEDNRNVGRMAALLAGLPIEVAGQTVNRLCGSGLQAVVSAAHAIAYGDGSRLRGRRRRDHDPRAARDGQAVGRLSARRADDVRHDPRLAVHQPAPGRCLLPVLDGRDGRERGRAMRRQPRGPGRLRVLPRSSAGRLRTTPAASPTRSSRSRSPTGGDAHLRHRRASTAGRDDRVAGDAEAGVQARCVRLGDGRQQLRHQRWRGGRAGHERGARPRARAAADRADGVDRGGRRRPRDHGAGTDSGLASRARARRHRRRRPRPGGAERGLRARRPCR